LSPEPPDPELSAQLEAGYLVSATIDSTRVTDARARIRVIEAEPPESQSPAHRELLAQLLFTRTMTGSPHHEIVELAQRIWAGGRLLDDGGADSQALWQVIGALSWADAYESSLQAIDLVLAAADRRGLALAHARARYARAWPNYWTGQLAAAAADALAAIEIWHGGLETYLPAAIYWLGRAELERGDAGAAARALTLAEPFERWAGTGMMPFIHALRGHLAADAGSPAEALVSHLECGREIVALLITNPTVMPWRSQAALAARLAGDERQARALATEELELSRVSGAPRAIGVALRAAGICTGGSRGIRLLRESVDALGQSGATLEYGRAQIDLGAAIRRSGKRRDARPHLKSGLELTRAAGATVLARRAETELSAAGGRARQSSGAGPQTLTASERRVAELAAVGHTNRYIAGLLQISVKAVEWHLHQSYRKLDIDGRRQLPAALTG
jgi:DNA-binding CsgD family transcriptional regulator